MVGSSVRLGEDLAVETVVCHTQGCGNAGIPLEMGLSWPNEETGETEYVGAVYCGVCGKEIRDVRPPLPGTEPPEPDRPDNELPESPEPKEVERA